MCSRLGGSSLTLLPSRIGPSILPSSVRPRHAEHVLPDIRHDEVVVDRGRAVEARLAELPLDVVFLREAVAAMAVDAGVAGGDGRFGGEVLGHVGLRAARDASVEHLGGLGAHESGGLDRMCAFAIGNWTPWLAPIGLP